MKQISEVEEKPFTSSVNFCPEACCIGKGVRGGRSITSSSSLPYFPADPWIFHLKTTYPVFSFSVVSFMYVYKFKLQMAAEGGFTLTYCTPPGFNTLTLGRQLTKFLQLTLI